MRITANQVTLARLLLLPLPVALMYGGSRGSMVAALVAYSLLGLTDAVDGMLARRYGPTSLGALLDPVVDKIFIVACYVPLADLGVVPLTLVVVLFIRELGVTVLRSSALEEGFSFRTSPIAKLKTSVQMAGFGFILLLWLFPDARTSRMLFAIIGLLGLLPCLLALARRRRPSWIEAWTAFFVGVLAVSVFLNGAERSILVISAAVVLLTLVSGAEYAWGMRRVLAARFARTPLEALRFALLSLAVPLLFLPLLARPQPPTFAVLGLLATELAQGGLDNSLVQAGRRRGAWPDLLRAGVQALFGALLLAQPLALGPSGPLAPHLLAWTALALSLVDLAVRASRNLDVLLASAPPGPAAVADPRPQLTRMGPAA